MSHTKLGRHTWRGQVTSTDHNQTRGEGKNAQHSSAHHGTAQRGSARQSAAQRNILDIKNKACYSSKLFEL